jgi:hypothetical protein
VTSSTLKFKVRGNWQFPRRLILAPKWGIANEPPCGPITSCSHTGTFFFEPPHRSFSISHRPKKRSCCSCSSSSQPYRHCRVSIEMAQSTIDNSGVCGSGPLSVGTVLPSILSYSLRMQLLINSSFAALSAEPHSRTNQSMRSTTILNRLRTGQICYHSQRI